MSELHFALVRTFIARGLGAVGTLVLGFLIGRLYGADGLGVFSIGHAVVIGGGILAQRGVNFTLIRFVGRDADAPAVRDYLLWAAKRALIGSSLLLATVLTVRDPLADLFDTPELAELLLPIAVSIPPFTLAMVLAGFMKGVRRPASASLLENGWVSVLASPIILTLETVNSGGGVQNAGWGFATAAWLVLFGGVGQSGRWLRSRRGSSVKTKAAPTTELVAVSRSFLVLGLAAFLQEFVVVAVAGYFLSERDLGLLKAAERLSLTIGFVLIALNAVLPPRFAAAHHAGDMSRLTHLAHGSVVLGSLIAVPFAIVGLVFPAQVLSIYGEGFREADAALRILVVGQLVNVATGSIAYLLAMTGHERTLRNVILAVAVWSVMLQFIVTPTFGMLGAAVALTSTVAVQNVVALFYVRRHLAISPLPTVRSAMAMWRQSPRRHRPC